jgi:hypothetical protein
VRNPPRIMHQAESANPKNTRNFYRVFDESGYISEAFGCGHVFGLWVRPFGRWPWCDPLIGHTGRRQS